MPLMVRALDKQVVDSTRMIVLYLVLGGVVTQKGKRVDPLFVGIGKKEGFCSECPGNPFIFRVNQNHEF